MKTNQYLLAGKRTVLLLIASVLLGLNSTVSGQAHRYSFQYHERIVSDYSALFGGDTKSRLDSIAHSGVITLQQSSDTVFMFEIATGTYSNTSIKNSPRLEVAGYFILDSNHRIRQVIVGNEEASALQYIRGWLGEINFRPVAGARIEQRQDGMMEVAYSVNSGKGAMRKSEAGYTSRPGARTILILDSFQWRGDYDPQKGYIKQIYFAESKRQAVGRRITACVSRDFAMTRLASVEASWSFSTAGYRVEMYPQVADADRTLNIARSLLKNDSIETLLALLQLSDTIGLEDRFRLKSRIRSALQLEPGSIDKVLAVLDTTKNGNRMTLLEDAVIESKTSNASQQLTKWLNARAKNYESLKDILIRVTLANALTDEMASELIAISSRTADENTRNLVELSLAAYAGTRKNSDRKQYELLASHLQQPYRQGIRDTMQYLYVIGNAGLEAGENFIAAVYPFADTTLRHELIYALRNIHTLRADSIIYQHLLVTSPGADVFNSLLADRDLATSFKDILWKQIIAADKRADTTKIGALQFLLDNAYRQKLDIGRIRAYSWTLAMFRNEITDFFRQGALCRIPEKVSGP